MNYLLRMEKQELPSTRFHLPPGFGFHPSDQELITHYLQNKVSSHPLPATVIADIDLYKYNPWELPKKALFGEDEWYFFSPRDRKYPNGVRPNRAAASGYWKATGIDKPILTFCGRSIGLKKSLVFYTGRPPKGSKTDWIMNEYRLPDQAIKPQRLKGSMRLDDWVLCRVRQKGNVPKYADDHQEMQGLDIVMPPPKVEIACPESKYLTGMNADYIYGDWQVKMASLLTVQSPPGIENSSCISFQGSYDSPTTVSSVFNHMDTLKRTTVDVDVNGDLIQATKKKREEGYADGDLLCRTLVECDTNHYIESQNQELIFNLQPDDPVIDFPEVNDWAWKQMLQALP